MEGTISQTRADDYGAMAEWYLTVRCANPKCARLIAFKKSVDPGNRPNLCIAITGKPSVICPRCKVATRFCHDQIERRQVVLTQ
jgi:hypothetical protein